jgi:hypothetical protein
MHICRRGEPWYSCVCRIPMYHPAPPKTYLQIHMYHPFTSKASLFPAAKKIMVDTYVSFFRQEPSKCAPVRAELRRSELFLPCFQNFFFVSSVYSVPSQLLARICRLVIATLTPPPPLRCHCRRHVADAFTLTPPPPLLPPRRRHAYRCLRGCCAVVIVLVLLL